MVARTHETIIAGYAKELAVFARPALISDATQLIGLNKCFRSDTIPAPQKNYSVLPSTHLDVGAQGGHATPPCQ